MVSQIETKTDLKNAILDQLHLGKGNAITKDTLAKRLHVGERDLRQTIRELRHDGKLIGLSVRKPYGYFLIETAEELQDCMDTFLGYCVESARARRDLKVAGRKLLEQQFLDDTGQLKLRGF